MTFFANMIHMAVGEAEASLDFYHLSPRDVHLAKTRKANMQIQPVVRVIVAPVLAKHFFDQLRPHVDQRSTLQQVRGGKVGHAAIAD